MMAGEDPHGFSHAPPPGLRQRRHARFQSRIFALLCGATGAAALGVLVWQRSHPRFVLFGDSAVVHAAEIGVVCCLFLGAWWGARREHISVVVWLLLALTAAPIAGGYAMRMAQHYSFRKRAQPQITDITRRLRLLVAEEEDVRLRSGRYSEKASTLGFAPLSDESISLAVDGDRGWRAEVSSAQHGYRCAVYVRDIARPPRDPGFSEGIPYCALGGSSPPIHASEVHAVPAPSYVVDSIPIPASGDESWTQYRADAWHSGACCAADSGAYRWTIRLGAPIRATPAVAGNFLLVGAHGTGELAAFDRRTGHLMWRTRAPNWIHNDPVVARGVVVVGFGNKDPSPVFPIVGSPPSGAAAYDLRSGRRLWVRFTEGTVMISPAILGDVVAFAANSREVFGAALATGQLRWHTQISTEALMGNLAIADSTVYISGDPTDLCAVGMRRGNVEWCSRVPGVIWRMGESSPAVTDSLVIITARRDTALVDVLGRGQVIRFARDVVASFRGKPPNHAGEQLAIAFSRRTGAHAWTVSLGGGFDIPGNAAGTATVSHGTAYVISPIGRTITAIDVATGRRLWQRPSRAGVRGSLSVIDDKIIELGQDRVVRVLSTSGDVVCTGRVGIDSDRAGATVAGRTAYLLGQNGMIAAMPIQDLLQCRPALAPR